MKYLLSLSLVFLSVQSFAVTTTCVLSTGNYDLYPGTDGALEIVDRKDNMVSGKEYFLTDFSKGIMVSVTAYRTPGDDSPTFSLSTENRVYHWPKDTYSQGIQVSGKGQLKVDSIEKDYEVSCLGY